MKKWQLGRLSCLWIRPLSIMVTMEISPVLDKAPAMISYTSMAALHARADVLLTHDRRVTPDMRDT